jgi:hypothetical protein
MYKKCIFSLIFFSFLFLAGRADAAGYVYFKVDTAPVKKYVEGSDSTSAKSACSGELSGDRERFLQNARGRKDLDLLVAEINTQKAKSGKSFTFFTRSQEILLQKML